MEVPLLWTKDPKIIPSRVKQHAKGGYRFYVLGDFGYEMESLQKAKLFTIINDARIDVNAEWKSNHSCQCRFDCKSEELVHGLFNEPSRARYQ